MDKPAGQVEGSEHVPLRTPACRGGLGRTGKTTNPPPESDGFATAPGIREAVSAIEAAGGAVRTHDYPGTHHAFFNDDRPEVYDRYAAATSWARTLEVLRATL